MNKKEQLKVLLEQKNNIEKDIAKILRELDDSNDLDLETRKKYLLYAG